MRTSTRFIGGALALSLMTQLAACGTLFYPDRRGQISGKVDPVIVALDAIGILFYVIPGLIAFGIDFATGAIYLPNGKTAQVDPEQLRGVLDANGEVDRAALKALIETQTGTSLPLDDPRLVQKSGSIQQLAAYGLVPAA
ncbi:Polyribonucleotide nucleotidyltransferase (polynucleotide phosphorylase) [Pseudomonas marincola]|uniref:Polyribonucleotide nucleotidyltransferase n=1 Tax=Pseudomonas marincola TaxID=437900 RepID=A0A653DYV0_9PSED|nr:polyribonucleotide nucleotidyltransferase [Pseudomonas marincola]MAB96489.1 polyribonucleotide nucleotidyltransferase [Pseudomonadaceae bacterium]CAE6938287.1 Polyribonucleotide nucleotidyltransferase (polynucleotide phosphorylase) [Pseudomonas marincola]